MSGLELAFFAMGVMAIMWMILDKWEDRKNSHDAKKRLEENKKKQGNIY